MDETYPASMHPERPTASTSSSLSPQPPVDPTPVDPIPTNPATTDTTAEPSTTAPPRRETSAGNETARLRWLLGLFFVLAALVITPYVAGRIQYEMTAAQERARYEAAQAYLGELGLDQLNTAHRMLAQAVAPSVVSIRTRQWRAEGRGSGVIVDQLGYILTNHHVVAGLQNVEIELSDGRRASAAVVGVDPHLDLAVLKTELSDLIAASWGDSDQLQAGELVWALGSPFGLNKTITRGIVSATERRDITPGSYTEFLQTDAAVNPGNSGGPLVNVAGEVVGINTAIIGDDFQGVSFAIPSSLARSTYEAIRRDGYVVRGFLGIHPSRVSQSRAQRLQLKPNQGVLVAGLSDDTPADSAGLELGDVILSWNGDAYSDPTLLSRAIAATEVGSTAAIEVIREADNGPQQLMLEVLVGTRPPDSSRE